MDHKNDAGGDDSVVVPENRLAYARDILLELRGVVNSGRTVFLAHLIGIALMEVDQLMSSDPPE